MLRKVWNWLGEEKDYRTIYINGMRYVTKYETDKKGNIISYCDIF